MNMNKLLLNGSTSALDKYIEEAEITVKGNSTLNSININNNFVLDILIEKDSTLTFNMFNYANNLDIVLNITCDDNAKFVFNNSFITNNTYNLKINTNLYGSNIVNDVNIRGLNEENGSVKIVMNGTIAGETKDNVLNEFAKIINKSKNANVLIPNLIVNTNEVEANHGVSIGRINDEELFYLMSKGINKKESEKLIKEGFILSIMVEDNKNLIKNILMGR